MKIRTKQLDGNEPSKQVVSSYGKKGIPRGKTPAVPDTKYHTCRECGEEFCSGNVCKRVHYEEYERVPPDEKEKDDDKEGNGIGTSLLDSMAMLGPSSKQSSSRAKLRKSRIKSVRKKKKKKKPAADKDSDSDLDNIDQDFTTAVKLNDVADGEKENKGSSKKSKSKPNGVVSKTKTDSTPIKHKKVTIKT